jgi:hypothetical protein
VAKTIDDALNLFATGKSSRECEKLTGIPKSTVDREAKKRGVIKGSVGHLIADKVKVEAEIGTLPGTLKTLVNDEVNKQLAGMEFYQTNARKAVKMGLIALSKNPTESGMKTVLDGMKSGMQVEGLVPFYPSSSVFNNVNAQNNEEKIVKIEQVIVDSRS